MPSNIGKIAGPMLVDNLERLGVDLSIETDLLYVDVSNRRIGVNTSTPSDDFAVDGNVSVSGNVAAENFVGPQITVSGDTISATDTDGNLVLAPNGLGVVSVSSKRITNVPTPLDGNDAVNKDYVDNRVDNEVSAIQLEDSRVEVIDVDLGQGNVVTTVDGNVIQFVTANGVTVNSNLVVQNIVLSGNSVSSLDVNGNVNLTPNGQGTVVVNTTTALTMPVGTTSERPATPQLGQTRFNSATSFLEYYNGTEWINASAMALSITSQTIQGDGSTDTFALNESTTTEGILVSINGTVQKPFVAYEVVGRDIVFAEPPAVTDFIDVRYIAAGYAISEVYLPTLSKAAVLALPSPTKGQTVFVNDGDAGNPCLAVFDGAVWKVINFGLTLV